MIENIIKLASEKKLFATDLAIQYIQYSRMGMTKYMAMQLLEYRYTGRIGKDALYTNNRPPADGVGI